MNFSKIRALAITCFMIASFEAFADTQPLSLEELQKQFDTQVAQGDVTGAYETLLRVLEVDPDNVQVKRILLDLYMRNEKWDDAQKFAIELMYDDPKNRRAYQNVYNQISSLKPFNISGGFSIAPSTNVNSGTSADTFTTFFGEGEISDEAKAKSGYGIQANLNGYFKSQINPQNSLRLDWSLYGYRYPKFEELNTYVFDTSITYAHTLTNKAQVAFGLERAQKWTAGSSDYIYLGKFLSLSAPINDKTHLGAYYENGHYEYNTSNYLDGAQTKYTLSLTQNFKGNISGTVYASHTDREARLEHHAYTGKTFGLSLKKNWDANFQTRLNLYTSNNQYVNYYPGRLEPRADKILGVGMNVKLSEVLVFGFAPEISCNYRKSDSNVAFYQTQKSSCTLGFTRNF